MKTQANRPCFIFLSTLKSVFSLLFHYSWCVWLFLVSIKRLRYVSFYSFTELGTFPVLFSPHSSLPSLAPCVGSSWELAQFLLRSNLILHQAFPGYLLQLDTLTSALGRVLQRNITGVGEVLVFRWGFISVLIRYELSAT